MLVLHPPQKFFTATMLVILTARNQELDSELSADLSTPTPKEKAHFSFSTCLQDLNVTFFLSFEENILQCTKGASFLRIPLSSL
jgi:hypothetical protein